MEGEDVRGGDVMGLGDGDVSADVMEKGSLSPLTGSYLLIVLAEPHSEEDREIILQRLNKGLLSWNVDTSHVDLNCELLNLANSGPEGDEARNGEKLVQWASENLVVEVLIHSQVNTLQQCMKNLLASFTRHRHIIHAGYTFQGSGSWVLQDGTFSLSDYLELWGEAEVQRILSAYKGDISVSMHCASENGWTQERFDKEPFAKLCQTTMNPPDKMSQVHNSGIGTFIEYISKMLIPTPLKEILEPSDIVGNIRFSHPTLYVFPGGQGDAALFGINGFNMLIDGGFSRKSCFWDFTRHLDRLDAVLLTRVNNNSVGGLSSVIQRKVMNQVYPQIGHFFGNVMERKMGTGGGEKHEKESAGGEDEQQEKLLLSLNDEGQKMVENLRNINLKPHLCFRETHIEPINLYHKVGHGKLDLYVLNPAKDSREVKDFLSKWNSDCKSFVSSRISSRHDGKDFQFPVLNLVSICALLVWQPANPRDPITRILFPGSTPQYKIFEALQKLKHLEFLKYPVCTAKTIAASHKSKVKSEKIISEAKQQLSKVGSHGDVGGNAGQPSSTDGSLSRTALTKTATSSSSTIFHRSSSRTKAAMAAAAASSSSKEDIQPTKERVASRRLVSKSSAAADSNKLPLKSSESPIHKKQIKSSTMSTKISTAGKISSSTKIPAKGPLKSASGKGKETSATPTPASITTTGATKKTSPTSPAKTKIGLKSSALGKTAVGLTKASAISSDTPPQTPPKSAKDANNRRVIETKTKLKSNVKTEAQKQQQHKVEEIKRKATSKVSSIPKSVPSKSPTHTPSAVAVKRLPSAKKPVKEIKEKAVKASTPPTLPDDLDEEKKIKVETNGSIIRDETKAEEQDQETETEQEPEPDSQPSSLPPAAFLPTESGSELSSLDHISVHEQDGATASEDLSLTVISKDQFESETLHGDGVIESEQDEEEEEYLIVEKDESTTDNVESERILTKNVGSLDESCPTTPQIPTEAEAYLTASELEEQEKITTREEPEEPAEEKESLADTSSVQEDAATEAEKADEGTALEKLETEIIPSDQEKDEDEVEGVLGKDEECDNVEVAEETADVTEGGEKVPVDEEVGAEPEKEDDMTAVKNVTETESSTLELTEDVESQSERTLTEVGQEGEESTQKLSPSKDEEDIHEPPQPLTSGEGDETVAAESENIESEVVAPAPPSQELLRDDTEPSQEPDKMETETAAGSVEDSEKLTTDAPPEGQESGGDIEEKAQDKLPGHIETVAESEAVQESKPEESEDAKPTSSQDEVEEDSKKDEDQKPEPENAAVQKEKSEMEERVGADEGETKLTTDSEITDEISSQLTEEKLTDVSALEKSTEQPDTLPTQIPNQQDEINEEDMTKQVPSHDIVHEEAEDKAVEVEDQVEQESNKKDKVSTTPDQIPSAADGGAQVEDEDVKDKEKATEVIETVNLEESQKTPEEAGDKDGAEAEIASESQEKESELESATQAAATEEPKTEKADEEEKEGAEEVDGGISKKEDISEDKLDILEKSDGKQEKDEVKSEVIAAEKEEIESSQKDEEKLKSSEKAEEELDTLATESGSGAPSEAEAVTKETEAEADKAADDTQEPLPEESKPSDYAPEKEKSEITEKVDAKDTSIVPHEISTLSEKVTEKLDDSEKAATTPTDDKQDLSEAPATKVDSDEKIDANEEISDDTAITTIKTDQTAQKSETETTDTTDSTVSVKLVEISEDTSEPAEKQEMISNETCQTTHIDVVDSAQSLAAEIEKATELEVAEKAAEDSSASYKKAEEDTSQSIAEEGVPEKDGEGKAEATEKVEETPEITDTAHEKTEAVDVADKKASETADLSQQIEKSSESEAAEVAVGKQEISETTAVESEKSDETHDSTTTADEKSTTEVETIEMLEATETAAEKSTEAEETSEKPDAKELAAEKSEVIETAVEKLTKGDETSDKEATEKASDKAEDTEIVAEKADATESAAQTAEATEKAEETESAAEKAEAAESVAESADITETVAEKADATESNAEKAEATQPATEKAEETESAAQKAEATETAAEKAEATEASKAEATESTTEKAEATATEDDDVAESAAIKTDETESAAEKADAKESAAETADATESAAETAQAKESVAEKADATESAVEKAEAKESAVENAQAKESAVEKAEAKESVAEKADATESAVEKAEAKESAVEKAETKESAAENADATESAAEKAEETESVAEKEEATESASQKEEATESAAQKEEATESAAHKEEATESAAHKEEATESAAEKAEATESAAEKAEATESAAQKEEATESAAQKEEATESAAQMEEATESAAQKEEATESPAEKAEAKESAAETAEAKESVAETAEAKESAAETAEAKESVAETDKATESAAETAEAKESAAEKAEVTESSADKADDKESAAEKADATKSVTEKDEEIEVVAEKTEVTESPAEKADATELAAEKPEAAEKVVEKPEAAEKVVEKPEITETIAEMSEATETATEKPEAVEKAQETEGEQPAESTGVTASDKKEAIVTDQAESTQDDTVKVSEKGSEKEHSEKVGEKRDSISEKDEDSKQEEAAGESLDEKPDEQEKVEHKQELTQEVSDEKEAPKKVEDLQPTADKVDEKQEATAEADTTDELTEKVGKPQEATEKVQSEPEATEKAEKVQESTDKVDTEPTATQSVDKPLEATEKVDSKSEATEKSEKAQEATEKVDSEPEATEKVDDKPEEVEKADDKQEVTDKVDEKLESVQATETSEVAKDDKKAAPKEIDTADKESHKPEPADSTLAASEKPIQTEVTETAVADEKEEVTEKVDVKPEAAEEKSVVTDEASESATKVEAEKIDSTESVVGQPEAAEETADESKVTEKADEKPEAAEKADEKTKKIEKADEKAEASEKAVEKSEVTEKADEKPESTDKVTEKEDTTTEDEVPQEAEKVAGTQEVPLKTDDSKKEKEAEKSDEQPDATEAEAADDEQADLVEKSSVPEKDEGKHEEVEKDEEKVDQIKKDEGSEKTSGKPQTLESAEEKSSIETTEEKEVVVEKALVSEVTSAPSESATSSVDALEASSQVEEVQEPSSSASLEGLATSETPEVSKETVSKEFDKLEPEQPAKESHTEKVKDESETAGDVLQPEGTKKDADEPESSETKEEATATSEAVEEVTAKEAGQLTVLEKEKSAEEPASTLDTSIPADDKSHISPETTTTTVDKSDEKADALVNWEIQVGAVDTGGKKEDKDEQELSSKVDQKEISSETTDKQDDDVPDKTAEASEKLQVTSEDVSPPSDKGKHETAATDDKKSEGAQESELKSGQVDSTPEIQEDKSTKEESVEPTAVSADETKLPSPEPERKVSMTSHDVAVLSTESEEKCDDLPVKSQDIPVQTSELPDKKQEQPPVQAEEKTGESKASDEPVASIAKSEETELAAEEKLDEKQDTVPEKADKQDSLPSSSISASADKKEESSADGNLKEDKEETLITHAPAVEEITGKAENIPENISDKTATDTITETIKSQEIPTEKIDATTTEEAELSPGTEDDDNQTGEIVEKPDNDTEKTKEVKPELIQTESSLDVGSPPKEPTVIEKEEIVDSISGTSKGEKVEALEIVEEVKSAESAVVLEPADIGTTKQTSESMPSAEIMSDDLHEKPGPTLIEGEVESTSKVEKVEAHDKPSEKIELQTEASDVAVEEPGHKGEVAPEALELESEPAATDSKVQPEKVLDDDNIKEGKTGTEIQSPSATEQSDLKNVESPKETAATTPEQELITTEDKEGEEETEEKVRSTLYVEETESEGAEGIKRSDKDDDNKFIRPLPYQETITSEEGLDKLAKEGRQLAEQQAAAEVNKRKEEEKIVGIPSAIPSKLPRVSREVIRTPDEVADLPVHEEVEPGTYETDDHIPDTAETEDLSEEDAGVEAIEIANLPSSPSPTPVPAASRPPVIGDLPQSLPETNQDQDPVTKVQAEVHPDTILLPSETEFAAVVTKIDAAVSPVLESLLGQSPPKTFPPAPAESAEQEQPHDKGTAPSPTGSKTPEKELQPIQITEAPDEPLGQHSKQEETTTVSKEQVLDKIETETDVDTTEILQATDILVDVKSEEKTAVSGEETKGRKMIDITVTPEAEKLAASELAAKPITSVVITPSTPPVSIAGSSEFNYSDTKQQEIKEQTPTPPQTADEDAKEKVSPTEPAPSSSEIHEEQTMKLARDESDEKGQGSSATTATITLTSDERERKLSNSDESSSSSPTPLTAVSKDRDSAAATGKDSEVQLQDEEKITEQLNQSVEVAASHVLTKTAETIAAGSDGAAAVKRDEAVKDVEKEKLFLLPGKKEEDEDDKSDVDDDDIYETDEPVLGAIRTGLLTAATTLSAAVISQSPEDLAIIPTIHDAEEQRAKAEDGSKSSSKLPADHQAEDEQQEKVSREEQESEIKTDGTQTSSHLEQQQSTSDVTITATSESKPVEIDTIPGETITTTAAEQFQSDFNVAEQIQSSSITEKETIPEKKIIIADPEPLSSPTITTTTTTTTTTKLINEVESESDQPATGISKTIDSLEKEIIPDSGSTGGSILPECGTNIVQEANVEIEMEQEKQVEAAPVTVPSSDELANKLVSTQHEQVQEIITSDDQSKDEKSDTFPGSGSGSRKASSVETDVPISENKKSIASTQSSDTKDAEVTRDEPVGSGASQEKINQSSLKDEKDAPTDSSNVQSTPEIASLPPQAAPVQVEERAETALTDVDFSPLTEEQQIDLNAEVKLIEINDTHSMDVSVKVISVNDRPPAAAVALDTTEDDLTFSSAAVAAESLESVKSSVDIISSALASASTTITSTTTTTTAHGKVLSDLATELSESVQKAEKVVSSVLEAVESKVGEKMQLAEQVLRDVEEKLQSASASGPLVQQGQQQTADDSSKGAKKPITSVESQSQVLLSSTLQESASVSTSGSSASVMKSIIIDDANVVEDDASAGNLRDDDAEEDSERKELPVHDKTEGDSSEKSIAPLHTSHRSSASSDVDVGSEHLPLSSQSQFQPVAKETDSEEVANLNVGPQSDSLAGSRLDLGQEKDSPSPSQPATGETPSTTMAGSDIEKPLQISSTSTTQEIISQSEISLDSDIMQDSTSSLDMTASTSTIVHSEQISSSSAIASTSSFISSSTEKSSEASCSSSKVPISTGSDSAYSDESASTTQMEEIIKATSTSESASATERKASTEITPLPQPHDASTTLQESSILSNIKVDDVKRTEALRESGEKGGDTSAVQVSKEQLQEGSSSTSQESSVVHEEINEKVTGSAVESESKSKSKSSTQEIIRHEEEIKIGESSTTVKVESSSTSVSIASSQSIKTDGGVESKIESLTTSGRGEGEATSGVVVTESSPKTESVERKKDEDGGRREEGTSSRKSSETLCGDYMGDLSKSGVEETSHSSMYTLETSTQLINLTAEKEKSNIEQASQAHETHTISSASLHSSSSSSFSQSSASAPADSVKDASEVSRLQFSSEDSSSTKTQPGKSKEEEPEKILVESQPIPSTSSASSKTTSQTVQSSSLASETSTSQFAHSKSDVVETKSVASSSHESSGVTGKAATEASAVALSGATSSKSVITRRFSSQEVSTSDLERKEDVKSLVGSRRRASEIIEHCEDVPVAAVSSSASGSEAGASASTTTEYVKVEKEKEVCRTSPGGSFYGGYGYVFGSAADDEVEENPTDEESVYGDDSQSHSLSTRDSNQSIIFSSDVLPTTGSSSISVTTTTTTITSPPRTQSIPQPIQIEQKLISLEKESQKLEAALEKVEKCSSSSSYFPISHDLLDEGSYSSGDFSDSQLSMVAGGKDAPVTDEEIDNYSHRHEKKQVAAGLPEPASQDVENGNSPSTSTTTASTSSSGTTSTSTTRTILESSSSALSALGTSPVRITTITTTSSTSTAVHTAGDPNNGNTKMEVKEESSKSVSSGAAGGSSFSSEYEFSSTAAPSSSSRQKEAEGEDILKTWGKPLGLPPVQSDEPQPSSTNEPESSTGLAKGTPKKDKSVDRKNPGTPAKSSGAGHSTSRGRSHHRSSKNTNPIYVDLAYVPHHGNSNYCDSEFFRLVRSRYYVFSGLEPSREVFDGLLQGKQQWEDKNLEVTIIPTYDTDTLGYWVVDSEDALAEARIDLAPSASRCTINLQDHETSCSAYRLEF